MTAGKAPALSICFLLAATFALPASFGQGRPMPPRSPMPPQAKNLEELINRFNGEKGKKYLERYRTVNQFRSFKSEKCVRFLEQIYKTDTDTSIRRSAVSTLSTLRVPYARKVLKDIINDPNGKTYLTYAIRGLANFNDLEAFKDLVGLLLAPAKGASTWPARSPEVQRNSAVLVGLRGMKLNGKEQYIVSEVLSKPKGKELWKKMKLIGVAATKVGKAEHQDTFLKLSEERSEELRAEAVYALDSDPLEEKVSKRLVELLSDKAIVVAVAATVVIGKHGPASALKPLIKLSKGKNGGLAAAAVEALGGYPESKEALSALKKAIKKKKPWQVVAAAISGFSKRHKLDSIEILVSSLKKLKGRLLADACRALKKLTGQDLGLKAKDWTNWWKSVKKGYTMPAVEELAKREKEAESKPKVRVGTKSRNPSYYGSEVVSKRLAFIVDFSGSMGAKVKTAEGEFTRLELAKGELIKVIRGLGKDAFFNLLFFGTNFNSWQKTLIKATKGVKGKAIAHTNSTTSMGGTNIYDPLEKALQDPNVDTIYLLSDGSPGSGKFTVPADILREIKKINATRRVVIHTISFGSKSQFMKDLAKQNNGDYIER
jgi:HEAT repeat protein